jgi:hypothetical protein
MVIALRCGLGDSQPVNVSSGSNANQSISARSDSRAPVRTLVRPARLVRDARSWPTFGLRGARPQVDLTATLDNARRAADYAHDEKQLGESTRRLALATPSLRADPGLSNGRLGRCHRRAPGRAQRRR